MNTGTYRNGHSENRWSETLKAFFATLICGALILAGAVKVMAKDEMNFKFKTIEVYAYCHSIKPIDRVNELFAAGKRKQAIKEVLKAETTGQCRSIYPRTVPFNAKRIAKRYTAEETGDGMGAEIVLYGHLEGTGRAVFVWIAADLFDSFLAGDPV